MERCERQWIWKLSEAQLIQLSEELNIEMGDRLPTTMKLKIGELASKATHEKLEILRRWATDLKQDSDSLSLHKWVYGISLNECQDIMKEFSIANNGSEIRQRKALITFYNQSLGIVREGFLAMAEDFSQRLDQLTNTKASTSKPINDTFAAREGSQGRCTTRTKSRSNNLIDLSHESEVSEVEELRPTVNSTERGPTEGNKIRNDDYGSLSEDSLKSHQKRTFIKPPSRQSERVPSRKLGKDHRDKSTDSHSSSDDEYRRGDHEKRAGRYGKKEKSLKTTAAIMETVRKWGIHYSKTTDPQDALSFLELVEEKANCYQTL